MSNTMILMLLMAQADGGLALPAGGPASFDVAGVKLDMTPDQTRAALAKAGYALDPPSKASSFEREVAQEVSARRNQPMGLAIYTAVGGQSARGRNGESVTVRFAQTPAGSRVSEITFSIPADRQFKANFHRQLEAKFGDAAYGSPMRGYDWCSKGETKCTPLGGRQLPNMQTVSGGSHQIYLRSGRDAERRLVAARTAEVERQAPSTSRAAF